MSENISFADNKTALRINGKVKAGHEDVPKESYHSISLEEGTYFSLTKPTWLHYQKKKLEEATAKKYSFLLCIFDREEVIFAMTKKFGFDVLAHIKGDVAKKGQDIKITKDFFQDILKALDVYNVRHNPEKIILASPAFYKETLFKQLTNKEVKDKIVLGTVSSIDNRALTELILRPEVSVALKDSRARKDKELVDQLLAEINKDGLAKYGWEDVHNAIQAGAVSTLIITDECIQRNREDGKFAQVDQLLQQVETLHGKVHLLSAENEAGKQVNGLGGVAAIVRYKL